MIKQMYVLISLLALSLSASPFHIVEEYLVTKYCLKSKIISCASWACAYYFAFKKDALKRYTIKHPRPVSIAQEQLWQDAVTAQHMLAVRGQLECLQEKYDSEKPLANLTSYDECFNFSHEYSKVGKNLSCTKLIWEFRQELNKNK